jgi:uncharacterized protein involved in response to NO
MLQVISRAPHRVLFFAGAANVLLAMLWWALWMIERRWQVLSLTASPIPEGWLHAIIMQYQVLPTFMFGFLLTVFPRWMNQPALSRRHYVPVGVGMLSGQLLTLVGAFSTLSVMLAGALVTLLAWLLGLGILGRLIWRDAGRVWHANSCYLALWWGWLGFALYVGYLSSGDARFVFAAIKFGGFALLLPIFFSVCHRMIPFFATAVFAKHTMIRPTWALAGFWIASLTHLWLELRHGYAWLWVVDLPLAILCVWLLWHWVPRERPMPWLLQVLFFGFGWLPLALLLYAAQSAWFAYSGEFILGRAPVHALMVGCFGSLLVAMVTRVTQGHSGEALVLGRTAAIAFVLMQLVAVVRIAAEILPDQGAWQAAAAIGWLIAFVPWLLRSMRMYVKPRVDGRPG